MTTQWGDTKEMAWSWGYRWIVWRAACYWK